ncbi:MAG: hypothetical protein IT458_00750 [Planctomycetes bacterium]|nr:hypothetical protein [Planctomycetota bacterium]
MSQGRRHRSGPRRTPGARPAPPAAQETRETHEERKDLGIANDPPREAAERAHAAPGQEAFAGRAPRVRKQVYELTLADLERYPAWEYAEDEEDVPGQDEATVRPLEHVAPEHPGVLIVACTFTAADGTVLRGYCHRGPRLIDLGAIQPYVITPFGHVGFWWGLRKPMQAELRDEVERLGTTAERLFPLHYRAAAPPGFPECSGPIAGFFYVADGRVRKA